MNLKDFIKICAVKTIKIYHTDGITTNKEPVIILNRDYNDWKCLSESLLDKELYLIATEDLDTISVELNNFKEN